MRKVGKYNRAMALGIMLCALGIIMLHGRYVLGQSDCRLLQDSINEVIEKSNYCHSPDNCVVKTFGCPFDCYSLINKNSDIARIETMIKEYRDGRCPVCNYGCLALMGKDKPSCVSGKCNLTTIKINTSTK